MRPRARKTTAHWVPRAFATKIRHDHASGHYFLCLAVRFPSRYLATREPSQRNDSLEPQKRRAHDAMRRFVGWTRFAGMALLMFQVYVAAFAQEEEKEQHLGASQPSQTGQTGPGVGNMEMAAAKPGQADGAGNPRLGERRPLYRLNCSDVVALTFTLSPELDQTLTIQPDGYVALKDAPTVLAQGLTLEQFRVAVRQ